MGAACPVAKACQDDPDLNFPWPKLTDKLAKFTTLLKPLISLATNSIVKLTFHIIEGIAGKDFCKSLYHSLGIKSHGDKQKSLQ